MGPAEGPVAHDGDEPQAAASRESIEERLVERARAGDVQAWARLYQDYFDRVYRRVVYLTGDVAASEDLVQDAFARAMVAVDGFAGRSSFSTWLLGIAANVVRMHWRSAQATRRMQDRFGELGRACSDQHRDAPDRAHDREERLRVLYAVLATLPDHLREAFVLRELEGLSVTDVAMQLDISAGNVAVRAHRARAKVRDELARLGWLTQEEGP